MALYKHGYLIARLTFFPIYLAYSYIYVFCHFLFPLRKDISTDIALITGAGSGIGREIAFLLSKRVRSLVLLDLNITGLKETKEGADGHLATVFTYRCDVSSRSEVASVAARVKHDAGKVDILINNAGISGNVGRSLIEADGDLIEKTLQINSLSNFWMCKQFLGSMLARNHGHIVTMASILGYTTWSPYVSDYIASKYAAVGFSETLRHEINALGATGVTVTTVAPNKVSTDLFVGVGDGCSTGMMSVLTSTPQEVATLTVDAIETGREFVTMPRVANTMAIFGDLLFPNQAIEYLARSVNIHEAATTFSGVRYKAS